MECCHSPYSTRKIETYLWKWFSCTQIVYLHIIWVWHEHDNNCRILLAHVLPFSITHHTHYFEPFTDIQNWSRPKPQTIHKKWIHVTGYTYGYVYDLEECSQVLGQRKQAKMQWLLDPDQSTLVNLNNARQEASRHFRNKKWEHLKAKVN